MSRDLFRGFFICARLISLRIEELRRQNLDFKILREELNHLEHRATDIVHWRNQKLGNYLQKSCKREASVFSVNRQSKWHELCHSIGRTTPGDKIGKQKMSVAKELFLSKEKLL